MAKALSTRVWLDRAIADRSYTLDDLAIKLNRSKGYVRDILSGRKPGLNLREAVRDLARGKRTPTPAPPPRRSTKRQPAAPKREIQALLSPIAKAAGEFEALRNAGIEKVVINIKSANGRWYTLGARGGIDVDSIRSAPSFEDFVEAQAGLQGYARDIDLVDVSVEEY